MSKMVVGFAKGEKPPQHVAGSRKRCWSEDTREEDKESRRLPAVPHYAAAASQGSVNTASQQRVWGELYKSRQNFVDMHFC